MVIQVQLLRNSAVLYACCAVSPTLVDYNHIVTAVRARGGKDDSILTVTEGSRFFVPGAGYVDHNRVLPSWPPVGDEHLALRQFGTDGVAAADRLETAFKAIDQANVKVRERIAAKVERKMTA